MEFTIIFIIVLVLGVFIWMSYKNNKKQDSDQGSKGRTPGSPTHEERLG